MDKAQHLMRGFERRPLTDGEIALARPLFAEAIDWPRVRITQLPPLNFGAMVPIGRGIVFSRWRAWRDFADAPLGQQGWFVHELAHVWQAGRGVVLAAAKLKALGKRAYAYEAHAGAKLKAYNIERQAEIVRHLFLARAGVAADNAPPLAWLEHIWAAR